MDAAENPSIPDRSDGNSPGIVGIAPAIRAPLSAREAALAAAQAADEQGEASAAVAGWRQAVALCPEDPRLRVAYGHALLAVGAAAQAATVFSALRQEGFASTEALRGEAEAQAAMGEIAAALELVAVLRLRAGEDPAVARLAARLHREQGEAILAVEILSAALRRHPDVPALRLELAQSWLALGEREKGLAVLEPLRPAESGSPEGPPAPEAMAAAGLRAALEAPADSLPPLYIRTLFDQYAERFDNALKGRLRYQAPELLWQALEPLLREPEPGTRPGGLEILDLGCGTGLSGLPFAPLARTLVGVDLAPRMLAQARQRGIYHQLWEDDAQTALIRLGPARWDLILAADVLVYLGDLRPLMQASRSALRPGGRLAATVEALPEDEGNADAGFQLGPRRRFQHARHYMKESLIQAGLELETLTAIIPRWEGAAPVAGLLFVARRPEAENPRPCA